MNRRVKALWIPGVLTMLLSLGLWPVLRWAFPMGFQFIIGSSRLFVLFYPPWLLSLAALGALGAYCSSRAGGTIGERLIASLFPALQQFIVFSARIVVALHGAAHRRWGDVFSGLLTWVLVPALALLIGSLAFLRRNTAMPGPSAR
jgi:hypothetical protein